MRSRPGLGLSLAVGLAFGLGGVGLLTLRRPTGSSVAFEALTADEATLNGITVSRALQKFCPTGSAIHGPGTYVNANVACTNDLGLFIEPAATNQVIQNTNVRHSCSGADWCGESGEGLAESLNASTAPSGVVTSADRQTATATSHQHRIYQGNKSYASGTVYTASVYVAAANLTWFGIQAYDGATGACAFNVATGTAGGCTGLSAAASISPAISAGGQTWYRLMMTFTAGSTTSSGYFLLKLSDSEANAQGGGSWAAGGTERADIWAPQLETGTVATSPIITGASSETRDADLASIATPAGIVDGAGCASAVIYARNPTSGQRIFGFGSANRLALTNATVAHFNDSANTTSATAGSTILNRQVTTKVDWTGAVANVTHDGVASGAGTYDGAFHGATLYIGSDGTANALNGFIEGIKLDESTTGCD